MTWNQKCSLLCGKYDMKWSPCYENMHVNTSFINTVRIISTTAQLQYNLGSSKPYAVIGLRIKMDIMQLTKLAMNLVIGAL